LEGALALSKLYKDQEYMKRAVHHLRSFLDQNCA
jgi:TetR/AcrR family transcriptional regulator, transcriptional repressor for nem operon